jgi:hypothetical protein
MKTAKARRFAGSFYVHDRGWEPMSAIRSSEAETRTSPSMACKMPPILSPAA